MSGRGKGVKRKRPQRRETRVVPNDVVPRTTTSSVACQAGDGGFAAAAVVSDTGVADADKSQLPTPINMGSHMLDEGYAEHKLLGFSGFHGAWAEMLSSKLTMKRLFLLQSQHFSDKYILCGNFL